LNYNPIVELELNLDLIKLKSNFEIEFKHIEWILILYKKKLMSFTSTNYSTMIFVVSLFFNVFSLGANKEDLFHVTYCIISSLLFD
jgi:hypothetical protein